MPGRLELRRWLQVYRAAYSVAQSGDGQYVAVGHEAGMEIFNLSGHRMAVYPTDGHEMPVHRVSASLDFTRVVLATRLGDVVSLDMEPVSGQFEMSERLLHTAQSDIHALTFSVAEARIATGHLSYTLTMLDLEGGLIWQQQDEDTAALGSIWSVALTPEGTTLYAGTAGANTHWLVALDAADGTLKCRCECDAPVTGVAALPENRGVVVTLPDEYYTARVVAYAPDLSTILWEKSLDGPATALTADLISPVVAVAVGYEGEIMLLDAVTGAVLAAEPLRVMVNGLSLVRSRFIAAATQDGNVALLRYLL